MGDVRVSIIEIIVDRSKSTGDERTKFMRALKTLHARLEALLPNRRKDILCGKMTDSNDVVQIAAEISNICTLNMNTADTKVLGFAQSGYLICQALFGMSVSKDAIKEFVNSSEKNKSVLTEAYGFLNGFLEKVKDLPEKISGPLSDLRDTMDIFVGNLDAFSNKSSAGW